MLIFTHCHAFGIFGGNQPVSGYLASDYLQELNAQYPLVFTEPKVHIGHNDLVHFEHRIRLKKESVPLFCHKIYPLGQDELTKL